MPCLERPSSVRAETPEPQARNRDPVRDLVARTCFDARPRVPGRRLKAPGSSGFGACSRYGSLYPRPGTYVKPKLSNRHPEQHMEAPAVVKTSVLPSLLERLAPRPRRGGDLRWYHRVPNNCDITLLHASRPQFLAQPKPYSDIFGETQGSPFEEDL